MTKGDGSQDAEPLVADGQDGHQSGSSGAVLGSVEDGWDEWVKKALGLRRLASCN